MKTQTSHLSQDDLVLYHYGDAEQRGVIARHLIACETCRAEFDRLEKVLSAVSEMPVPERPDDYGARVWQRLSPKLREPIPAPVSVWLRPQRWVIAAALAVMLLSGFLAGRFWRSPEDHDVVARSIPGQVRERILMMAVSDHLEQSQRLLVELVNAGRADGAGDGLIDISSRRKKAEELIAANRIFRQTVAEAGDAGMSGLLDDLERVLMTVAHGPEELTGAELQEIRQRIEQKGLLFKIRVLGSQANEREKTTPRETRGGRT
ncbi:MAG TPA: hypothetical protein VFG76_03805 [Candidatus Polarisedimenticolia bacterium]|nr:hypothetical protein [Candidatus Polarisedimenticolia bacterium]